MSEPRRYELANLIQAAGNPSLLVLASRLGISRRTLYRWQHSGVPDQQADRAAITLGLHPCLVWKHW